MAQIFGDQFQVAFCFATVKPYNCKDILLLLGREIVDLACDLAVDIARIDHQHLVSVLFRLVSVQEPQLAGHGPGIEEVGADSDHDVHVAGLDELLAHLGLVPARTGGLGGHDEPGPAPLIEVAVEVTDPDVVAVADLAFLVDAGQAEGQARIVLDLVGVDLVHVKGRIGHDIVSLAHQFMGIFVISDGLLDITLQAMYRQVHLGQADGGGILLQSVEGELLGGVFVVLFHHTGALHEHAAGTAGRIEHDALVRVQHMGDE